LLHHVEGHFFSPRFSSWSGECQGLVVAEAANRRAEAEAIAREMIRLSREEGLRWREMAVLLRDGETYGELMAGVLADHDIPVFSDGSRPANRHPLAELLRSALEVVVENWNYEPVFRCLKTDLCGLKRDEVDILENYCLEFGIRGSRWTRPEPWTFRRRFSLADDVETDQEAEETLAQMNELRQRTVSPLAALAAALKPDKTEPANAAVYGQAVYQFLLEMDVPGRLEEWAAAKEQAGELEPAREHRQIWREVMELLDQLVETFAEETMPLAEFAELIGEGLDGLTLSLIPPGLDYVTVGLLEHSRLLRVEAVFVPGANDGCLPMRRGQEGLLSDGDRERLAGCGVELAGGAADDTFAEQFLVYTALSRAGRQLWISCPLADADGKGLTPSPLMKRLRELSGVPLKTLPLEPPSGRAGEYLSRPRPTLAVLNAALRQYRQTGVLDTEWWAVYNWAASRQEQKSGLQTALSGFFHRNEAPPLPSGLPAALYCSQNRLRGSVTRFESFRACPFRHFAQYGLGLKERPVHRLSDPDLGQFLHAVLKEFGEQLQAEGRDWGSLPPEEVAARVGKTVMELAPRLQNEILLSSRQYEHLLERLRLRAIRACGRLAEMARVSRFKPLALELSFGRGAAPLPPLCFLLASGTELEVVGQIDRLDGAEKDGQKLIAVLDYKSGNAGLDLAEVYHGLRLQLLTYMLAVRASGDYQPAALLYFFLKNPVITGSSWLPPAKVLQQINSRLKLNGWILAEPEVVRMLDESMEGWSEFLKVAFTKDGFHKSCWPQLKTGEEFSLLLDHVARELPAVGDEMMAGTIAIAPSCLEKRIPCGYCVYRTVCQFDRYLPENNYRFLTKPDEERILQQLRQSFEIPGGEKE
ncbi:MAG TPA: PD-(D/E)XK nuclease family protein, partial [Patescibacteria group bacterium]|nr:PD-(D/E)XK nuclease family protein [Patescibacteria group bacterium]